MQFKIEQVALAPEDPIAAIELLSAMGLSDWARDHVCAAGLVFGSRADNEADLAFNYQATRGIDVLPDNSTVGDVWLARRPLELEMLQYARGDNWLRDRPRNTASHLGMHCSAEELVEWRAFFAARSIAVAQEVNTVSHTNPTIAGQRWYTYVIFDTRDILGIDVKFIVRYSSPQGAA